MLDPGEEICRVRRTRGDVSVKLMIDDAKTHYGAPVALPYRFDKVAMHRRRDAAHGRTCSRAQQYVIALESLRPRQRQLLQPVIALVCSGDVVGLYPHCVEKKIDHRQRDKLGPE